MFIDEAVINVKSGDGGNGCTSFRREKYIEFGGPDGGHGGHGGDVILIGSSKYNTLSNFKYNKRIFADNGKVGQGNQKHGKSGGDKTLYVPIGTQVLDYETRVLLYDISEVGQKITIAKGGAGGAGNMAFKTSVNQAPRKSKPGKEGEFGVFVLQLKLFCDIGIIGMPNIGKSTLLNSITNTKSVVADYSFTTIKPVLGVLEGEFKHYILADIPGLIEGASENRGLGHRFLRHIERCKAILHMIDITSKDLVKNYKIIRSELEKYSPELMQKQELIVFSKSDCLTDAELAEKIEYIKKVFKNRRFIVISSITKFNLDRLSKFITKFIDDNENISE